MSKSERSSTIPGAETVVAYRDWVSGQPRAGRGMLFVGLFALILITGFSVEILQSTLGKRPAQVVLWIVALFLLYTWYAILRPSFAYLKGLI